MIGQQIRDELRRPLEGDRDWIRREERGFVHRVNPEHLARVHSAKIKARVEEDVRNFRRSLNRRRNDLVLS